MLPSISEITPVILTKQKDSKIALENLKKAKKKEVLRGTFLKFKIWRKLESMENYIYILKLHLEESPKLGNKMFKPILSNYFHELKCTKIIKEKKFVNL